MSTTYFALLVGIVSPLMLTPASWTFGGIVPKPTDFSTIEMVEVKVGGVRKQRKSAPISLGNGDGHG